MEKDNTLPGTTAVGDEPPPSPDPEGDERRRQENEARTRAAQESEADGADDEDAAPKDPWQGWKLFEDPDDDLGRPTLISPGGRRIRWDPHERRWDAPEDDERDYERGLEQVRERMQRDAAARRARLEADE